MLIRWMVVLGLGFALGCSDDETGQTSSTNNATTTEVIRDQQTIPDLPEICDGCFEDGVCVPGTGRNACGADGASCTICREAEECTDQECVPKRTCNANTCTGCCTTDDVCVTGTEALACGAGGTSCDTCDNGAACIDQRCTTSCGPDNCAGCCDAAGQCVTTTSDTTCGGGGAACQNCETNGSTCAGNGCVAPACSSTCASGCCAGDTCILATTNAQCGNTGNACMACPNGQSCSNGACMVNMTTTSDMWDIVIIDGTVDYWDYDAFSPPDPYLDVYFQNPTSGSVYEFETYSDYDTYSPVWNETISGVPTAYVLNGFVFDMWDEDAFSADEICTGMVTIPTMADLGGPVITTVCTEYPEVKVRWKIVAHP